MSSLVLTLWRTWIGRVALATSWWLPHKQRAFVGFLEKEIVKDKIAILDTGENPEAPASREMSDLEVWCHCNLVCAIYRVNLSAYFCVHYIQGDLFGLLLCALYTGWSFRPTFVCTIYRVILSAYFWWNVWFERFCRILARIRFSYFHGTLFPPDPKYVHTVPAKTSRECVVQKWQLWTRLICSCTSGYIA